MEDKKLGSKLYAVFDRTYMAFGSICNSCQHIITEKNKDGTQKYNSFWEIYIETNKRWLRQKLEETDCDIECTCPICTAIEHQNNFIDELLEDLNK